MFKENNFLKVKIYFHTGCPKKSEFQKFSDIMISEPFWAFWSFLPRIAQNDPKGPEWPKMAQKAQSGSENF